MKKIIVFGLFFVTIATLVACVPSNNPKNPALNGQTEVIIEVGDTYLDPGVD